MLAEAETKTKVPFANHNGQQDRSNGSNGQIARLKRDMTNTLREIAKLKKPIKGEYGEGTC